MGGDRRKALVVGKKNEVFPRPSGVGKPLKRSDVWAGFCTFPAQRKECVKPRRRDKRDAQEIQREDIQVRGLS